MTLTLETLGQQREKTAKRQRIGVINRYLGWIAVPIVIAAVSVHYSPNGHTGELNEIVKVLQFIFVPIVLVHTVLSFYVFGWVPFSRTLRVAQIWLGYAYVLLMLGSQTTFAFPEVHFWLTAAMFVALAVHVGIGIFYAARRRQARAEHVSASS